MRTSRCLGQILTKLQIKVRWKLNNQWGTKVIICDLDVDVLVDSMENILASTRYPKTNYHSILQLIAPVDYLDGLKFRFS